MTNLEKETLENGGMMITIEARIKGRCLVVKRLVELEDLRIMPSDHLLTWFTDEMVAGVTVDDVSRGVRG